MDSYNLYIKTSPLKLFFIVSLPGAISMIASSLWGLFDGIFVGQVLGETAFAALNLAFPFVLIGFSLADLVGVGSSVPISIALGQKRGDDANNYFSCACLLIVLTSAVTGAIFYLTAPALMRMMGATGELAALGVTYLQVYALFGPVTSIMFAVDNFLRICGRIRSSMLLNILMSVLILGLEYIFLIVLRTGMAGSPLAVSLGMMTCVLIAFYPFVRGKLALKFVRPHFSRELLKQIVTSGSPNFLSNIAARLTSILMNMAVISLGGDAGVSVYGILMYAGDIVQQLLYGSCDSLQPAIGYNWGAGDVHRVGAIEKCCLTAGAAISAAGALIMFFFPGQIASLFLQDGGSEVLAMTIPALRIYSFTYLTRWFGFCIQSLMTALDKPLPAVVLSVAYAFALPVLLLLILRPLGLTGVWLNTPITSVLVAVLAAVLLLRSMRSIRERGEDRQATQH